jgi:membrane protein
VFADFLAVVRRRLVRPVPLIRYLFLTTETHALCGALAFFAMLAFYPVSLLLVSLAKHVLRSPEALDVVRLALQSYYPASQDFLLRNLEVSSRLLGDVVSLRGALWILLGGAGVFIPLEMAFNRLWGFSEHRPYWSNQVAGLVLTMACWALAVALVLALARLPLVARGPLLPVGGVVGGAVALYLVYRFLPHGKVPTAAALPAAILTAVTAEGVRWLFALVLPLLRLPQSQGPFHVSVSFLVFVYVEAFVLLGGAYLAAEATLRGPTESPPRAGSSTPVTANPP